MDCEKAQQLIDSHVEGAVDTPKGAREDQEAQALAAHLATCQRCAAYQADGNKMRSVIANAAADDPTPEEIESMWTNVRAAAISAPRTGRRHQRTLPWRFVAACMATAACLIIAFGVGFDRYGLDFHGRNSRKEADRTILAAIKQQQALANIRGIATASLSYAPDDPNEMAIPRLRRYGYGPASAGSLAALGYVSSTSQRYICPSWGEDKPAAAAKNETQPTAANPRGFLMQVRRDDLSLGAPSRNASPKESATAESVPHSPTASSSTGTAADFAAPDETAERNETVTAPAAMVIKTGELTCEVAVCREAVAAAQRIAAEHGGTVADSLASERDDGALSATLTIRVAPERFDELFAALKSLGRVITERVHSQDVTADYVDLEARLKSLQVTEERLQDMLKNKSMVDRLAAVLEVEREMTRVRGEIENLEGQKRVMLDRVAFSTITLTLLAPTAPVPNGYMVLEVANFDAARRALLGAAGDNHAQILGTNSSQQSDGAWMGWFSLRVRVSDFDPTVAQIESIGQVRSRQFQGTGIGSRARTDLDAVGTLNVSLAERSPVSPGAGRAGNTIRTYLHDGLAALYTSLGLIAYGLVVMSPWLVLVLLIGWLVLRLQRRRRVAP